MLIFSESKLLYVDMVFVLFCVLRQRSSVDDSCMSNIGGGLVDM